MGLGGLEGRRGKVVGRYGDGDQGLCCRTAVEGQRGSRCAVLLQIMEPQEEPEMLLFASTCYGSTYVVVPTCGELNELIIAVRLSTTLESSGGELPHVMGGSSFLKLFPFHSKSLLTANR